ncbi:lanthionine synthetase [Spirosoma sp. HMF4905]|uniref:Lanthionine synthetase n=1 Tax=Spirosoma arboris TaxID=2682092 RepID=A0A7K1SAR0_9BACT|nr:lanthionine synthetase C family protein [Spirosoma arboris]MVM30897.1 lanthionine synthetase [Spirosoma arboris]
MNNDLIIDQQTSVETLLHRIYKHVAEQPVDESVSLLDGQAGFALFESYYHRHFGINDTSRVWDRLGASIDAISSGKVVHTFGSGITGIAWSLLHLANNGFLDDSEDDPQEIIAALDEPLFMLSMDNLSVGDFDYLHGGLGACLYFLERRPTPEIDAYLTKLVAQLEAIAVKKDNGGTTWVFTNFGQRKPGDLIDYNIGLSHGTASIVAILCLLYNRGYAQSTCARLIEGTLNWMWSCRNKQNIAVFPSRVLDEPRDEFSRLGWCYGDLGIANAFGMAGETLRNDHWKQIADYTLLKTPSRRSRKDTSISDAGFCHGSAGASYLYSRYATRYQAPALEEASQYWLDDTLSRAAPTYEKDIFLAHSRINGADLYHPNLGLLEGESGIGLALLTHLGASPAWERLFLLS